MGSLYTRKDRNAAGVLVPSAVIWIKYRDASGRIVRESTKTDNAQEAKRLLKLREGAGPRARSPSLAPTGSPSRNWPTT
jgi:hypothetical protein